MEDRFGLSTIARLLAYVALTEILSGGFVRSRLDARSYLLLPCAKALALPASERFISNWRLKSLTSRQNLLYCVTL